MKQQTVLQIIIDECDKATEFPLKDVVPETKQDIASSAWDRRSFKVSGIGLSV